MIDQTLSVNDLTVIDGAPRILDVRLAEILGYTKPHNVRHIIREHAETLGKWDFLTCRKIQHDGAGRPGEAYYLTEKQALFVVAKSRTPIAAYLTIAMVEVFTAWRNGTLEQLEEDRPGIAALKRGPGYPKEGRIFDEDTIRIIRAEHRVGVPQREIAAKYDVSVTTINRIVNNLSYKDVKGLPTIKAPDDGFDDAAYMALMVLRMYDEVSDLCGIVTSDTTELRKLARNAVTFAGKSLVKAAQHAA